jgi:hypothetical protein
VRGRTRAMRLALAQPALQFPSPLTPADRDDIEIESLTGVVVRQKSDLAEKLITDRFVAACFYDLQSAVMKAAAARRFRLVG